MYHSQLKFISETVFISERVFLESIQLNICFSVFSSWNQDCSIKFLWLSHELSWIIWIIMNHNKDDITWFALLDTQKIDIWMYQWQKDFQNSVIISQMTKQGNSTQKPGLGRETGYGNPSKGCKYLKPKRTKKQSQWKRLIPLGSDKACVWTRSWF